METLRNFIFALLVIVLATGALVGAAEYRKNDALSRRVAALEAELGTLATALQNVEQLSAADRQELAAIAERSAAAVSASPTASQEEKLTAAVAAASPAVVSLVISKDVPRLQVEYVNPFGDDPAYRGVRFRVPVYKQVGTERREVGAGTGFLFRADGYIITNKHVVSDSEALYTALLSSGEQKDARVLYRSDTSDLAILKIDGSGYPAVKFADSGELKLGQTVIAIGNALGEYSNSVSVGIVSGLNRTIEALDDTGRLERLSGVVQTDAAINRGNSGGPLLDLSGQVVGVNVAIDQGANNIAFAIPINEVKKVVDSAL